VPIGITIVSDPGNKASVIPMQMILKYITIAISRIACSLILYSSGSIIATLSKLFNESFDIYVLLWLLLPTIDHRFQPFDTLFHGGMSAKEFGESTAD
jgi:hypothetical protein